MYGLIALQPARERRRLWLGTITVERELILGARYVVDPTWRNARIPHAGKRCVLLAQGVVAWERHEPRRQGPRALRRRLNRGGALVPSAGGGS